MFYIGIVNFGDLLTKGHSGCWDPYDFKALSVNFAFAHGLLEGSESSDLEASVKTVEFADFKQTRKQKVIQKAERVSLGVF